ncbi:MAG: amidohydrolase family protein, partial [Blastocatellia bacterium]
MNYGRAVFILILLAIVSPNLFAQGIKVITGATLIDGTGSAPNKDAVIVIEGARIKQVGAKGKIEAPKDAVVIDARGKFVMPGLADMHNHLRDGMFSQKPQALTNARQLLTFGVTTIFFPNANLQLLARLKQEAASDNAPYPRIFGAGPIVTVKGGSLSGELRSPTTAEEARAVVKEMKAANVEAIKLGYQAFTSEVGAEQFNSFLTNTAFTKTQMPT